MTFLFAKDLEQRFSYLDNPCRETGLRGAWITRPVLTVASSSRSTMQENLLFSNLAQN